MTSPGKKVQLEPDPPDLTRCQADIQVYRPFVMGGSVKQWNRCENKPTHVITEPKRNDGLKPGSMSVCTGCFGEAQKRIPNLTFIILTQIKSGT